jgi:hypothetical protein
MHQCITQQPQERGTFLFAGEGEQFFCLVDDHQHRPPTPPVATAELFDAAEQPGGAISQLGC